MVTNANPAVVMDECHRELIYGFACSLKPEAMLELGIGSAACTYALLKAIEANGHGGLTSVDNWLDWGGHQPEALPVHEHLEIYQANERDYVLECREKYGLIVSDGDHFGADGHAAETLALLEPGGVAFFHDVANPMFPNLARIPDISRSLGYWTKLFKRSTRHYERCDRGLLMVCR